MEPFENLGLAWTQGYSGQKLFYIDTDTICYQCGRNVIFLNENGSETAFTFSGQGVGPFIAHVVNKHFAIAERCINPKIYIYSFPSLEEFMILEGGAQIEFQWLGFSTSNFLISLSSVPDFQMVLWDYTKGKRLTSVKLTEDPLISIDFNPANWHQICVTTKSTVTVWNIEQSNEKYILLPQKVRLPPEDPSLYNEDEKERESFSTRASTRLSKYTVKIPQTAIAGLVGEMADQLQEIQDTTIRVSPAAHAWTPAGDIYVSSSKGHLIKVNGETYKAHRVFDPSSCQTAKSQSPTIVSHRGINMPQKEERPEEGPKAESLTCLGLHRSGLFAVGNDGILHLFDVTSGELRVIESQNMTVPITTLTFSQNYTCLALGSPMGTIYLLEVGKLSGLQIRKQVHSGSFAGIGVLAASADVCVTVREDGMVQIWSLEDGSIVSNLTVGEPASCLAASPLARFVVVGSATGHLYFLDCSSVKKPRIIQRLRLYKNPVRQLVFDPTGAHLFAGGEDANVFWMDGRPSSFFTVRGFTAVEGGVKHIAVAPKKDGFVVAIAENAFKRPVSNWDQIVTFEISEKLTRALRMNYKSTKCDLKDEAIKKVVVSMQYRSFGLALGEGHIAYAIGRTSRQITSLKVPDQMPKRKGAAEALISADMEFEGHQLRGGQVMLSPHLKWLASYGPDGTFMLRPVDDMTKTMSVLSHDHGAGGITAAAFTGDCSSIITAGQDGILCCFKWIEETEEGISFKPPPVVGSMMAPKGRLLEILQAENDTLLGMKTWEDPSTVSSPSSAKEKKAERKKHDALGKVNIRTTPTPDPQANSTWLEKKEFEMLQSEEQKYADTKKTLRLQIKDIRKTIQEMMRKNAVLPDIEKLSQQEFDLDVDEQARLQAEGEAEIEKVREDIEFDNLAKLYLREVIKKECWDEMKVKGRSLQAFNSSLEVSNFPLKERSAQALKRLQTISARRMIEMKELEIRKAEVELNTRSLFTGEEESGEGEEEGKSNEQPSITGSLSASYGGASDLFYSQFDLHLRHQKQNQIVLLEDAIHRIKVTFNKDFDDVFTKKEQEIAKIREKNKRITKILSDLDLDEPVVEPEMSVLERPELLFTVEDSEVTVERFLTPEQRKKLEELERLEEERRQREKGDNQRERALDMMMGGVLEIRKEDELKKDIPVPLFMQQKECTEWTEEEQKLARDYERRVKELNEEREKFRKQLETELRKLQSQIKEGMATFDETLNQLFLKKIKVMMVIYQEELKILRLRHTLLTEEELDNREKELNFKLDQKKEQKQLAFEAVTEARSNLDDFRNQYDIVAAEDKVMDKTFKRDFSDVSAVMADNLYRLFRKRPRGQKFKSVVDVSHVESKGQNPFGEYPSVARRNAQNQLEAALDEFDKPSNMPEGLDPSVWERLCLHRRHKIESENLVKRNALILAEMQAFLQRRQEEDEALRIEIDNIGVELARLKEDQLRFVLDLQVQLLLKQGQIEVDAGQFIPKYSDSVLIHRSVVEDLNTTIKQLGESKIASMVESKDFRRGIIQLEWEHKKMSMQMEDLENKMKDIQFMKVTKEIQAFLNETDYDAKKASEIATLEQTIVMQKKHHEKNVLEKNRIMAELRNFMKRKEAYNVALDKELEELNVCVNERRHIDEVNVERSQDTGQERRYHNIVQRRKLVDLAKAQAQEVAVLRAEVERLRMRTFPALVQVEH